jgi:hypothetical protein
MLCIEFPIITTGCITPIDAMSYNSIPSASGVTFLSVTHRISPPEEHITDNVYKVGKASSCKAPDY